MNLEALEEKYAAYQIKMRRWFHEHPEESGKEEETAAKIRSELDRMGVSWRVCGMPTGTLGVIKGARPGKTVLLRGDIDALCVTEETGLSFASRRPGLMHACGHDCHISMLLTAARMLKDIEDRLCGTVVLCFQPAEEIGKGAQAMIEDGALEGVDAAFGMHVWADVPTGKVALREGAMMASGDYFKIKVTGASGHGAQPHLCADATLMAASIAMNLQTVVSRETSPVETAVVSIGQMTSGTRFNVISGSAELIGTTRSFSREVRANFPAQLERIARSSAQAMRGDAELEYEFLLPPTVNDPQMTKLVKGAAVKVLGEDCFFDYPPSMGSEDFSRFQEKVPGVMMFLGIRNDACGACWPQHHSRFTVDEAMLVKGAAMHVAVALDFLGTECGA